MQKVVKNPYDCILVVATEYITGFAEMISKDVQRQCKNQFQEVVLCEANPEEMLKDVKMRTGGRNGKKAIMLLQGPVGGSAVQFMCDDADKPQDERRVVWIHSISVGLDYYKLFDFPHLVASIPITNGKRSQSVALAEHVMYAISYFNRKTWEWQRNKRERCWSKFGIQELNGQKMAILGYGAIGERTAQLAVAYGMEVQAVKRSLPPDQTTSPYVDKHGVRVFTEHGHHGSPKTPTDEASARKKAFVEAQAEMIAECDYVVNIMPGTPDTMKFFDKACFAKMKPTAVYVNIGRGCTNDEGDLVDALEAGLIRGAALDVFEEEPLSKQSPLWDVSDERLMLTCHSAAQTIHQLPSLVARFVSLAERWKSGEDIRGEEINRQFWY